MEYMYRRKNVYAVKIYMYQPMEIVAGIFAGTYDCTQHRSSTYIFKRANIQWL